MKRIKKKIHVFVNKFVNNIWFYKSYKVTLILLKVFSLIYYFILKCKTQEKKSLLNPFIVCVGNITVGGSGKTPCVIALYRKLEGLGSNVAFMTH